MKRVNRRVAAEIFPPGEFIRDELEARGWKQADLAEILGRPIPVINGILSGRTGISPETARGLAAAFGNSPETWLNLDAVYQLSRLSEPANVVARRARLYNKAPVREMIKRKWIEPSRSVEVLENRILDFFQIASLDEEPMAWPHAARRSTSYSSIHPELLAWLFRARYLANSVHASNFNGKNIEELLSELRLLIESPEEIRKVPKVLADFGIRFVALEPLSRTRIDGACLWLDETSPAIALSLRYDRIDAFWHTLLHELAHVKNRDGLEANAPVDVDLVGTQRVQNKPDFEDRADEFASRALIPEAELNDFMLRVRPLYSRSKIIGFAKRLQVHPGIVVGQLQFRGEISYAHSRPLLESVRQYVTTSALTDGWGHELGEIA